MAKFAFRAVNKEAFSLLVRDPNMIGEDGRPTEDEGALNVSFSPFQCQIASLNGALVKKNGLTVWKLSTEMLVDYEFGFRVDVLDQGLAAKGGDGDPDGRGGTWAEADIPNGVPITDPVLFNGQGQPLTLGADPVHITWSIYPEHDFKAFTDILPIKVD